MGRNTRTKPNGTAKARPNGTAKARPNGTAKARPNETETNHTARERERERERDKERKYNQFINKLSRALLNVRARSGYIQVPPVGLPTPATHCTPLLCLLFPSSAAFSYIPSFHPSPDLLPTIPWFHILPLLLLAPFRFRDIARGRGVAGRCSVAGA